MRSNDLRLAGAIAVALIAAAVLLPTVTQARPAFEVPVYEATADDSLSSANGQAWSQASATSIPLSSAGAGVPNADDTSIEQLNVEVARTSERLYLRVTWRDNTKDTSTDSIRAFADAVAVQFPSNASERPPLAMGGADNTVNVWYWNAEGTSEELLAGGPGSTTRLDDPAVRTNVSYADDRWRVVFSRPLNASSGPRTRVPANEELDVAFAVWNGSNMERSGQKAASEWYYLALGPGAQGPPYETILWAIAGIGIVVTTLVTIQGVRRTRGD
jgi:DMSO reductase family type II enzyme heme b subunit